MSAPDTLEAAQRLLGVLAAGRASLLQLATSHLPFQSAARVYAGATNDGQMMVLLQDAMDRRVGVAARRLIVVESGPPAAKRHVVAASDEDSASRPAEAIERSRPPTRLQRALVRGDGARPPAVRDEPRPVGAAPDADEPEPTPVAAESGPTADEPEPTPSEPEFVAPAETQAEPDVSVAELAPAGVIAAAVVAGAAVVSEAPVGDADTGTDSGATAEPTASDASPDDVATIEPVPFVEPAVEAVLVPDEPSDAKPVDVAVQAAPEPEPAPVATPVVDVGPPAAASSGDAVDEVPAFVAPTTDPDQPAVIAAPSVPADPPVRSRSERRMPRPTVAPMGNDERTDPRLARPPEATPVGRTAPPLSVAPSLAIPEGGDASHGVPRAVAPAAQLDLRAGRAVAAVRVAGAEEEVVSGDSAEVEGDEDGSAGVGEAVGTGLRVGGKKPAAGTAAPATAMGPRLTDDDEAPAAPVVSAPAPVRTAADDAKLESLVKDAATLSDRGDFLKAIQTYTDVLDIRYDRLDAYIGRGRSHLELGDYSSAMSDFQRAEDLSPDRPEPHVAMGDLYFARKEYRRAIECYDQAVELDGSHAMARCRRGISHYYRKNYRQAFQDLQRALTLDPEIPNIRKYVQMASKKMERPD